MLLLSSFRALAQGHAEQYPLDAAIQAVRKADNAHFKEAAGAREEARALLNRTPVTSPGFVSWAWQVAQLYQNGSLGAEARNVLEQALNRTVPLGDSHASHVALFDCVRDFRQREGNLPGAVGSFERAAATPDAASPGSAQPAPLSFVYSGGGSSIHSGLMGSRIQAYIRLAEFIPVAGTSASDRGAGGASWRIPQATHRAWRSSTHSEAKSSEPPKFIAVWQRKPQILRPKTAAINGKWWLVSAAQQSILQRCRHESVTAAQAVAAVKSAGRTDNDAVLLAMCSNLAGYLRRAGLLDDADRLHQWLLEQYGDKYPQARTLFWYSDHLVLTNRAAEAESMLTGYLADHPNMDPWQKSNVFWNLATIADRIRTPQADQYRKMAQALQPAEPPPPPPPAGQIRIAAKLQEAEVAVRQKHLTDAYRLTLDAANIAEQAADGQWIASRAPPIATSLALGGSPDKADEIYDCVFALAQTWKATTMEPLITLARVRTQHSSPESAGTSG